MSLSKTEEQLMEVLWRQEKAFLKDLIEAFPDPKPAATTVATLIRRMSDKGYIGHKVYGNSREYYPLIAKADYFSRQVNGMIKNYFDNSALQFASFFTKATHLSKKELEELKKIVEEELKSKKK
jgi:BlaI family transcriptional regulator, penicillinase repressor